MRPTAGDRLRAIGLLLTPLVVWAASFLGAWIGALLRGRIAGPSAGVELMVGGAVIVAALATVLWILLLRRVGRTRLSSTPPS